MRIENDIAQNARPSAPGVELEGLSFDLQKPLALACEPAVQRRLVKKIPPELRKKRLNLSAEPRWYARLLLRLCYLEIRFHRRGAEHAEGVLF